jgi:hypothetical protein
MKVKAMIFEGSPPPKEAEKYVIKNEFFFCKPLIFFRPYKFIKISLSAT